jgi:hypothetical protein
MKKLLFISIISIIAFGCSTVKPHIQHSEVTIVSQDTSKIWILNANHGPIIYNVWSQGLYGNNTKAYLVDSVEFAELSKNAVPCRCSDMTPKYANKQNVIFTSGK